MDKYNFDYLKSMICYGDIKGFNQLVKTNKIDFNSIVNSLGCNLLHCFANKKNLIKYLIKNAKIDINGLTDWKNNILHFVCIFHSKNIKLIKYLIDHGANCFQKNIFDETPLGYLKSENLNSYNEIVKYIEKLK